MMINYLNGGKMSDLNNLDIFNKYIDEDFYFVERTTRDALWTDENPDTVKVKDIWKDIKETIDKIKSILDDPINELKPLFDLINKDQEKPISVYELIARYFVNGNYFTRTGIEITRPDIEKMKEDYLTIVLDIFRIVFEWNVDREKELVWLGKKDENEDEKVTEHRDLSNKFGDLADNVMATIGRSITTAIPEKFKDAKEIVPFFMGLVGRKKIELMVQNAL
jgi:hypothetical protein